jgi:hypothetical protein
VSRYLFARRGPWARCLLILGGGVAFGLAIAIWFYAAHHEVHSVTKVTTTSKAPTSLTRQQSTSSLALTGERTVVTAQTVGASGDGDEPLVLGVLGLATALILASVFYTRITEVGVLGMTIKLGPEIAAAVRDVSVEAGDPALAGDALLAFLTDLLSRLGGKRDLDVTDVEKAKDRAIERISGPIRDEIEITQTDDGPRIDVESPEDAPVRVTSKRQMLPISAFDRRVVARIANISDSQLGRQLYAIDRSSDEVLAALSFELPEARGPIVIEAFTMHSGENRQAQAAVCATTMMSYLREVAKALGGDRRVLLEVDSDLSTSEQQSLGWLGMRPATSEEANGMRGVYWVDVASTGASY